MKFEGKQFEIIYHVSPSQTVLLKAAKMELFELYAWKSDTRHIITSKRYICQGKVI